MWCVSIPLVYLGLFPLLRSFGENHQQRKHIRLIDWPLAACFFPHLSGLKGKKCVFSVLGQHTIACWMLDDLPLQHILIVPTVPSPYSMPRTITLFLCRVACCYIITPCASHHQYGTRKWASCWHHHPSFLLQSGGICWQRLVFEM